MQSNQRVLGIDVLIEIKRNLKKDILEQQLKWNERRELNEAIKQRIEFLKQNKPFSSSNLNVFEEGGFTSQKA